MTDEPKSPKGQSSGEVAWLVPPPLSTTTRFQISTVIDAAELTPEVLALLSEAMRALKDAKSVDGAIFDCAVLRSCGVNTEHCPRLEQCGTNGPTAPVQ
jgi:hypothetical protein